MSVLAKMNRAQLLMEIEALQRKLKEENEAILKLGVESQEREAQLMVELECAKECFTKAQNGWNESAKTNAELRKEQMKAKASIEECERLERKIAESRAAIYAILSVKGLHSLAGKVKPAKRIDSKEFRNALFHILDGI